MDFPSSSLSIWAQDNGEELAVPDPLKRRELAHLHPLSPRQGAPGEGEAAVLPQAMRSELVLRAPGCCPKWMMWQHGPTWERKRNPLGYEYTCLRRPHTGPWVRQQTS